MEHHQLRELTVVLVLWVVFYILVVWLDIIPEQLQMLELQEV
jgi:hypothetical protein